MKIPVNKNIDEYKDDFFKGLTLRQTAAAALTLAVGIGVFFVCDIILGIPQGIALYLAMPLAFVTGASGFLEIYGMTPLQYIRKRLRIMRNPLYVSIPDAVWELYQQDAKTPLKKRKENVRRQEPILLESEEEIQQRMQFYEELFKDRKGVDA